MRKENKNSFESTGNTKGGPGDDFVPKLASDRTNYRDWSEKIVTFLNIKKKESYILSKFLEDPLYRQPKRNLAQRQAGQLQPVSRGLVNPPSESVRDPLNTTYNTKTLRETQVPKKS